MTLRLTPLIAAGVFLVLTALELVRPLRVSVEPKWRRVARNLALAAVSYILLMALQAPVLLPFAQFVEREGWGLANAFTMPRWLQVMVAVLVLDYTLWVWHWLNHKVPFLWRFHLVHHVDRDLDASTALRFHFGELLLSIGARCIQIALAGADVFSLLLWQAILFVSILFHHSNVRLPAWVERVLVRLIVTPRMHGIHHDQHRENTDSNWSSILTIWDVLHRTLRLNVPDESVRIGVPAWQNPGEITLGRLLVLPFLRRRDDWADTD